MINTAIGLILLYALLSLLASSIQETIAGMLSLRGKMLGVALNRMLGSATGSDLLTRFCNSHMFQNVLPQKGIKHSLFGGSNMPSYLSAKSFAGILMNLLNGSDMKQVNEAIQKLPEGNLKDHLSAYAAQAGNEIDNFRNSLENWYNDTMDRVIGWYKRQTHAVLIAIGLVLAVIFNADTFSVYSKVSKDPEAQKEILLIAQKYVDQSIQMPDTLRHDSTLVDQIDSLYHYADRLIQNDIQGVSSPMGLGWEPGEYQSVLGNFWSLLQKLAGCLITAFAVSLGAPFWFDLLKKLVNVRNAGNVPPTSTPPDTSQKKS